MSGDEKAKRFQRLVLPHLDAAYDLAKWLTRDSVVAEEATQEAFLRAYRFFDSFHGEEGRAWVFAIVRNTCFTLLEKEPPAARFEAFDEVAHAEACESPPGPEATAMAKQTRARVRAALEALPEEFRETVVLRELHGLSYKEIAAVIDAPIGTVMSRLARGRALLAKALGESAWKE